MNRSPNIRSDAKPAPVVRAWPELTAVGLFVALEILARMSVHAWPPVALTLSTLGYVGAAATAVRPRTGPVLYGLAVLGCTFVPPEHVAFLEIASFLVIFSLVARGRLRLAAVSAVAYVGLLTFERVRFREEPPEAGDIVPWAAFLLLAWLLGAAVRAAREAVEKRAADRARQERLAIAAELQDNVTHDLALIIMRVEQATLARGGTPTPELAYLGATARRCNDNTRRLMELLTGSESVTTAALVPLQDALAEAEQRLVRNGFSPKLLTDGDPADLPRSIEATLAKIAREATNNMIRHGNPQAPASILLAIDEHSVELVFLNGVSTQPNPGGGHGTQAMRDRVEALGGTWSSQARDEQWVSRAYVEW